MLTIMLSALSTMASASLLMPNPMSLAILILMMAMTTAFTTSILISSWLAFLLFLIYIGGMLVMFTYFVTTSPNSPMNMKPPLLIMLLTTSITLFNYKYMYMEPTNNPSSYLNTFFSMHSTPTLLMLALLLLLTMIIVVKLVSLPKGPLRPFL